jgi:deoxyribonuclease-4
MPLFGAHMSIAGGYYRALEIARKHDCEALQIFTKNANQWKARDLVDEDIRLFRNALAQTRVRKLIAHDSYLINLASPDEALYRRSLESFVIEMQRAERLGLDYLVAHPGAHTGCGDEAGVERVAQALDEVHGRCPGYHVQVLLEITAGQGSCLGHRFEHLADIIARVAEPERVGVCFDTCHAFAAGYPLAPEPAYRSTMREFDRIIGLDRLKAFHLNDSLKPLGSRVDRHAHIGRGCLGLEPFRLLINDRRFRNHPMLLETPKEDGPRNMDAVNLRTLRRLVQSSGTARSRAVRCAPQ